MRKSLNADFLSDRELEGFGIQDASERRIYIHKTAVIPNFESIEVDSDVRIDPYCVLSCRRISFGRFVHIAANCTIMGGAACFFSDFSGLSQGCKVFTSSDDYSGASLTNPTVPSQLKNVTSADVSLEKHVIIGAGSVILPGVRLEEGVAVGALSLVRKSLSAWTIHAGNPIQYIGERSTDCRDYESKAYNGL
ncbi:MAG: acyltransferase [Roseovarius sp.]|uniref:acyltransferase n=1 Tax=Roseovarius sp. TaxID=1486281 RepID=UPI0032ECAAEB